MIQLYISKKNFDAQKAERFFKERRAKRKALRQQAAESPATAER